MLHFRGISFFAGDGRPASQGTKDQKEPGDHDPTVWETRSKHQQLRADGILAEHGGRHDGNRSLQRPSGPSLTSPGCPEMFAR